MEDYNLPMRTTKMTTYLGRWSNSSSKVVSIDAPDMYIAAANLEYIHNNVAPITVSSVQSDVIVAGYYDIHDELRLKVHIIYNSTSPSVDPVIPGIIYGEGKYQPNDDAIISVRKIKGFKYIGIFNTLDGAIASDTGNYQSIITTDTEYYYEMDPNLADDNNVINLYASFMDSADVDEDTIYKFEEPYFTLDRSNPVYTLVNLNVSKVSRDSHDSIPTSSVVFSESNINRKYTNTKLDNIRVEVGGGYKIDSVNQYDDILGINKTINTLVFPFEGENIEFDISEFGIDKSIKQMR